MTERSSFMRTAAVVDPTLQALFASSVGPVHPAKKPRYSERNWKTEADSSNNPQELISEDEDESGVHETEAAPSLNEGSRLVSDIEDPSDSGSSSPSLSEPLASSEQPSRKRKRKHTDEHDDLETKYFQKVTGADVHLSNHHKMARQDIEEEESDSDAPGLIHESLLPDTDKDELNKATRTVFLSNVATAAVTSKKAKKELLAHLSSVIDKNASPPQSLVSLRFRSVPVATAAMPKRAAVITQAVMEATTKSTNAYAVYSDAAAARAAVTKLNGTLVLDRHLRTDSVAHPAPVDHKRCVFVGNLGFVDDETVISLSVNEDGKETTEKRKRTKVPMDVEEGLWRTFGDAAGKVENVRVVRDQATRVGKGIAYVQFYDANSVESALLLDGKKFPPLLPRALRVTRCKAQHKTLRAIDRATKAKTASLEGTKPRTTKYVRKPTVEERTGAGRVGKLLGRAAASRLHGPTRPRAPSQGNDAGGKSLSTQFRTPEEIVFEGHRASAKDGKPRDLKFKGSKSKKLKQVVSGNQKRRASRAANWKKKGSA